MQYLQFRIAGGTVRVTGEIVYHGGDYQNVPGGIIGSFEQEVIRTRGVKNAFFDLENWRRLASGEWEEVVRKSLSARAA